MTGVREQVAMALAYESVPFKIDAQISPADAEGTSGLVESLAVQLPYCGRVIKFHVLLSARGTALPPDVVFEEEAAGDFVELAQLRSLLAWREDNPAALLEFLLELRQLYQHHQRSLLAAVADEGIASECICLEKIEGAEYVVSLEGSSPKVICNIPVVLSSLPLPIGKPHASVNILYAQRQSPDVTLTISSALEALLPDKAPRPPVYPREMFLMDYLALVQKALLVPLESEENRRNFFKALTTTFGRPVEWDNHCTRISFVVPGKKDDPAHMLEIVMPDNFPAEQPTLTLQVMRLLPGRTSNRVLREYPYSPRWPAAELASRIAVCVQETVASM
eukprot:TRINITY_DN7950_c0_g1_i1.p1 TRINITY_DN7950_c0_g1~~TRINITY_DN7950_c0_g1_i1.p1  ORF type:complete len:335 (-),score=84.99 TRINITY_DN7950_c0_g1_i1:83-1087(-)